VTGRRTPQDQVITVKQQNRSLASVTCSIIDLKTGSRAGKPKRSRANARKLIVSSNLHLAAGHHCENSSNKRL